MPGSAQWSEDSAPAIEECRTTAGYCCIQDAWAGATVAPTLDPGWGCRWTSLGYQPIGQKSVTRTTGNYHLCWVAMCLARIWCSVTRGRGENGYCETIAVCPTESIVQQTWLGKMVGKSHLHVCLDVKASDLSLLESMLLRMIFFCFKWTDIEKIRKPLFIYICFWLFPCGFC